MLPSFKLVVKINVTHQCLLHLTIP
uniref:Uncharacterized protein n=1 Tax=Arundo donax TaxID=35708 RepID=A0A0A9GME2_ARUDO